MSILAILHHPFAMSDAFFSILLAPGKNDSDDHQHDANRTTHRESLDDRADEKSKRQR
jgi:hypothetical protein